MDESAGAFVPGHVTGFFSAHPHDDPAKAGSRGAGVTLSDGVDVVVESSEGTEIELDGETVEIPPVEAVLDALGVEARVVGETELPLGSGFGVSGAIALGAALSANAAFELGRSANELVAVAHEAEVQAGTGLGDVVAQARGGVPIRLEPGAPPHGRLDGIPSQARVEYVTFGELSTEAVLSGDTEPVTAAGERALSRLVDDPTLSTFLWASRRFARETDLLSPRLREVIDAVSEVGGEASMAMLGETVFALGTGLSDAGYDPEVCRICPCGAHLDRSF